ncbi:unnamed protein product [Rhizophagus irregularis]|nr:unnamed protein product [Rhizophagus irregularis]
MDFRCFDFGKRTELWFSVFDFGKFFWCTRLRKTKEIFSVLALGNEKLKGTPDVWMMESKQTNTLWIPSDIGWSPSQDRAGYLTLIAVLRFWESDRSGAPSPPTSILGLITCRFRSITLKLQFKWFGDIWEALLNRSHSFRSGIEYGFRNGYCNKILVLLFLAW